MRLRHWFDLWAGLALLAAAVPASSQPRGSASSLEALRAHCPTTRNLASEAFARTVTTSAAELDARQARVRGHLQFPEPPVDADVVLRAFAGVSITQNEGSETATTLWRLPDGNWQFARADYYPNRQVSPPPPPAPAMTSDEVEAARRSGSGGALDADQAARLDALLADPCLEAEPDAVQDPPVRAGIRPPGPCFDGVSQTVELVRGGRRRVYIQTCLRFLAGELIGLALYPYAEGSAPAHSERRSLATPQSARRFADQVLAASSGREGWINVTDAAGSYAFLHPASGFRCVGTQAGELSVYAPIYEERNFGGSRCLRDRLQPLRRGGIVTELQFGRLQARPSAASRVRTAAGSWFSAYFGSESRPHIRMARVTVEGVRMWRATVAGEGHVDARDDELTVVLGAEHDGWMLIVRATGGRTDPRAVEAAALGHWRGAIAGRVSPQRQ